MATVEQSLRPDVVIRGLMLGRNSPEEMFDGTGNFTITSEVIVTIENVGTDLENSRSSSFLGMYLVQRQMSCREVGLCRSTNW